MNDTLSASWEEMYQYACVYYSNFGNLDVQACYKTPEGYALGGWIRAQRNIYLGTQNGNITEERIKKLEKIGMNWVPPMKDVW